MSIEGPKILLVPPDVYDKAMAEGARTYNPDAPLTNDVRAPLVRDNFGVCKLGEGYEIAQKLFEPIRYRPPMISVLESEPCVSHRHLAFAYGMTQIVMPHPPPFLGIDIGKEEPKVFVDHSLWSKRGAYCKAMNMIHGRKRQEQSRLDRWSNVRRSKRARELKRRGKLNERGTSEIAASHHHERRQAPAG